MDGLPQPLRAVLKILAGVTGAALVVVGVLGLFLPFLQGILMILLGLSLLSLVSERAARWRHRLRRWVERQGEGRPDEPATGPQQGAEAD